MAKGRNIYKLDFWYASLIQIDVPVCVSGCLCVHKYEMMEKDEQTRIWRGNIENEISWFSTFHTDIDLFS